MQNLHTIYPQIPYIYSLEILWFMLPTLYDILEFMSLWECWHVLVLSVLTELKSFIFYFYNVMLFHSHLYISSMVSFWFSKWSIPVKLPQFQSWPTMSLSVHLPWAGCICVWSGSCIYFFNTITDVLAALMANWLIIDQIALDLAISAWDLYFSLFL